MNDVDEDGGRPIAVTTALPVLTRANAFAGGHCATGLALAFADGRFTIDIWPSTGSAPLRLGPFEDEDVIAIWRRLAAVSGLPLLLRGPDGQLQQPYQQVGRLLIGKATDRRRLAVLSGRRPRFLAKRRPSALPWRPRVHREVEIIAGRAR